MTDFAIQAIAGSVKMASLYTRVVSLSQRSVGFCFLSIGFEQYLKLAQFRPIYRTPVTVILAIGDLSVVGDRAT